VRGVAATVPAPRSLSTEQSARGQRGARGARPALAAARSDAIKARLRAQTEEAQRLGLFGAPSFTTADGELFWGNDRLEPALRWAKAPAARG